MKSLIPVFSLAFLIFSSLASAVVGIVIMVLDLYTGGDNFMQGFTTFCLGSILFFVCVIAYICTKINDKLSTVVDSMVNFFDYEINKNKPSSIISNMFTGFGSKPPEIKIMGSENNEEADKLIKLIFGDNKIVKKKLDEMNIIELETEKRKAIDAQEYEVAAQIRQLIDGLNKK